MTFHRWPGLVVGSLEILGNPTGLARSIGNGVSDLFSMPYRGLTKGPGAFLAGISHGMGSMLKHFSSGKLVRFCIKKILLIRKI